MSDRRGASGVTGWYELSRFAAIGSLLVLATGCAGESAEPAVAQGQTLYEANCASCHGDEAMGDGPMAASLPVQPPALKEHLGHHSQAQLVQLIQGGVPPGMPPTPLNDAEIVQIIDYLWTLVPEAEVAALRESQRHMEMMDAAEDSGAGMPAMPGMNHPMPAATDSAPAVAPPASEQVPSAPADTPHAGH